jgi:hypothetical protein
VSSLPIPATGSAGVHVLHNGPEEDPLGADQAALAASRQLLLEFADVMIPGHGAPFRPGKSA